MFLCWFPIYVSLCVSLLWAGFSFNEVLYSFVDIFWFGFQRQVFWRLISLVLDLRIGMIDVELKSHDCEGNVLHLWDPSWEWNALARVLFFSLVEPHLCFFYNSWCCPFLSILCSFSFQVPLRGNDSICSCIFIVSMGEGKLRIFLCYHLEITPIRYIWIAFLCQKAYKSFH